MKRVFLFITFTLAMVHGAFGQALDGMASVVKLDSRLTSMVPRHSSQRKAPTTVPLTFDTLDVKRSINVFFNSDGTVNAFPVIAHIKKGVPCPTTKIEALGVAVDDVIGSIALLTVPANRLYDLEGIEEIEFVTADQMNYLMNDEARSKTGVTTLDGTLLTEGTATPAYLAEGLSHAYTGQGVIVGVVDQGIDFNHIAFTDEQGVSRVKMVYTGSTLTKYKTAAAIANLTTDYTSGSHGSHTSATVAGRAISSYADRDLRGMAPCADMVLCGLGSSLSDIRIIESIKTVFDYADAEGKPAVVNLSLGNTMGRKDGSSSVCKAVDELTLNGTKPGRIVVFSAGNDGGSAISVVKELGEPDAEGYQLRTILDDSSTENKTITVGGVTYQSGYPKGIDLYYYMLDGSQPVVELKAVDINTGVVYSFDDKPLYNKNGQVITLTTTVENVPKYGVEVKASTCYFKDADIRLGVFVKGAQSGSTFVTQCSNGMNNYYTDATLPGYTAGDGESSINALACTDAIISVGSFVSRTRWQNIYEKSLQDGKWYSYNNAFLKTLGCIASYSSYGTDENGISRPDILAPGSVLLSAYNRYDNKHFSNNNLKDELDGLITDKVTVTSGNNSVNYFYGAMTGTSMASPSAAGIIALWLEQDPTLSATDIRRLLRLTVDNDEYTTDISNIPVHDLRQAGMGKINALAGMKQLVSNATNTLTLYETTDNSSDIAAMNGAENVSVTLEGRTFYKDGYWNTLCLPFDVEIAQSPLNGDGVTVKALDAENCSFSNGTLTLNFSDAGHTLKAGIPYLIKWDNLTAYTYAETTPPHTITSPTFRYVTIDGDAPTSVPVGSVLTFQGTFGPVNIDAGGDRSKLYLGDNNMLYYPSGTLTIKAQRAYFQLNGITANDVGGVRALVLNLDDMETQGIQSIEIGKTGNGVTNADGAWFTVDGRKLDGKPTRKGVYVHNGVKIVN